MATYTRANPSGWVDGDTLYGPQATTMDAGIESESARNDTQDTDIAAAEATLAVHEQNARYSLSASGVANGGKFTLTETVNVGGFVLASDEVQVPAAGTYLVSAHCSMTSSDAATAALRLSISVSLGGAASITGSATRVATSAAEEVAPGVSGSIIINSPASEKISIVGSLAAGTFSSAGIAAQRRFSIVRVK